MLMSSPTRLRRSCWRNALDGLACSDRCDSQVILGRKQEMEVSGVFGGKEAKVDRENLKKTHRSNKVGSKQQQGAADGSRTDLLCRRLWDRVRPRGSRSAACLPLRGPGETLGPSTCRRGPAVRRRPVGAQRLAQPSALEHSLNKRKKQIKDTNMQICVFYRLIINLKIIFNYFHVANISEPMRNSCQHHSVF